MRNIAPSATKIINPIIAAPQINVQTELKYPAIVKIPTFYGMGKDWQTVHAYNKHTGEIVTDKAIVERPVMGHETHIKDITRHVQMGINLKTGQVHSNLDEKPKTYHGLEHINRNLK